MGWNCWLVSILFLEIPAVGEQVLSILMFFSFSGPKCKWHKWNSNQAFLRHSDRDASVQDKTMSKRKRSHENFYFGRNYSQVLGASLIKALKVEFTYTHGQESRAKGQFAYGWWMRNRPPDKRERNHVNNQCKVRWILPKQSACSSRSNCSSNQPGYAGILRGCLRISFNSSRFCAEWQRRDD